MKKTALLLAVVLLLCLLPADLSAQTNTQLIVIGDNIVMLSPPQRVIKIGDDLLLPADVVASAIGAKLTVDRKENTIILLKGRQFITYIPDSDNSGDGVVKTTDKLPVSAKSFIKGNEVYIQASIAATEFNHLYTLLVGDVPRIKPKNWKITDSTMITIINSRPLVSNPEVKNPSHYLCFTDITGYLTQQLDILSQNKVKAIFFLTYSQIVENKEKVLTILAGGHTIGLMPEASFETGITKTAVQIVDEFDRCNELLYKLTRTNTSIVMFQPGSKYNRDSTKNTLSKAGYRIWKVSYEYPTNELESAASSTILSGAKRVVPNLKWNTLIYVKNTSNATNSLDHIIGMMKEDASGVKKPSDTSTPVYFYTIND